MPPGQDVHVVPGFIDRGAVAVIRARYADALQSGRIEPRGSMLTDTDAVPFLDAELIERVAAELRQAFPELPELAVDYIAYTRAAEGGAHVLHADAVLEDGSPNHTAWRVATAMLYLAESGSDFLGGAIHFDGPGRVIEPRAGLFVGFLTDWHHRHFVDTVTAGHRDALAFWFMDANKGREVSSS